MWVELVRSNRTDQLNPHLRSIFLSRDQPNPYNPPTKHGSMWVEPVPTHLDPPTKHTRQLASKKKKLGLGAWPLGVGATK